MFLSITVWNEKMEKPVILGHVIEYFAHRIRFRGITLPPLSLVSSSRLQDVKAQFHPDHLLPYFMNMPSNLNNSNALHRVSSDPEITDPHA